MARRSSCGDKDFTDDADIPAIMRKRAIFQRDVFSVKCGQELELHHP